MGVSIVCCQAGNGAQCDAGTDRIFFYYLPTAKQHELGGYETWLGTSRFEPQAAEKMLDTLLEMAAEVRAAK